MKIIRRIIIFLFIFFVILFVLLEIVIKLNGKQIIVDRLSRAFGRGVSVGSVKYIFPSGIFFENLDIPSALGAKGAKFTFDFLAMIQQGQIVLSEIILVEPNFNIEKRSDSRLTWGWLAVDKFHGGPAGFSEGSSKGQTPQTVNPAQNSTPQPTIPEEERHLSIMRPFNKMSGLGLTINNLKIINGKIHFVNNASLPGKLSAIDFNELYIKIVSFSAPLKSLRTQVDCAGVISGQDLLFDSSWFELNGWVNFYAKDMETQIKIIDPNGVINVFSDLNSKNNDLLVKGKISIKGSLQKDKFQELQASSFGDFLLGAVQKAGMDIDFDFSFNTKMDKIEIGKINLSGNLNLKGLESVSQPAK